MIKQVSQLGQGALSLSEEKPETTIFVEKKNKIFCMWCLSSLLFVVFPLDRDISCNVHVLVASEESGN